MIITLAMIIITVDMIIATAVDIMIITVATTIAMMLTVAMMMMITSTVTVAMIAIIATVVMMIITTTIAIVARKVKELGLASPPLLSRRSLSDNSELLSFEQSLVPLSASLRSLFAGGGGLRGLPVAFRASS